MLKYKVKPIKGLPPLLKDFSRWLSTKEWGSVGNYNFERVDVIPLLPLGMDDGLLLPFLYLPDGGAVALWSGIKKTTASVVYLGSEGQTRTLALNVADFLGALALEKYPHEDLRPNDEETESKTAELIRWLTTKGLSKAVERIRKKSPVPPLKSDAFVAWVKSGNIKNQSGNTSAKNILLKKLNETLAAHLPEKIKKSADIYASHSLDVCFADNWIKMSELPGLSPNKSDKVLAPLVPLFQAWRQEEIARGELYFIAEFRIFNGKVDRILNNNRNVYVAELFKTVPAKNFKADLKLCPKTEITKWLKEKLK